MTIEPATDADFAELHAWRYEPPYDFYDGDVDPVTNPERFFAVCNPGSDAVEQAARRIGPSVRQKNALPDVQGPQASLLIEKKP